MAGIDSGRPLCEVGQAGVTAPSARSRGLVEHAVAQGANRLENPDGDVQYYGYHLGGLHGTHFLFQGHETGSPGSITRVNLDADPAHRITPLATKTSDGKPLPTFDGSTWDSFGRKLLFTAENGPAGGVWESGPDINPTVRDIIHRDRRMGRRCAVRCT